MSSVSSEKPYNDDFFWMILKSIVSLCQPQHTRDKALIMMKLVSLSIFSLQAINVILCSGLVLHTWEILFSIFLMTVCTGEKSPFYVSDQDNLWTLRRYKFHHNHIIHIYTHAHTLYKKIFPLPVLATTFDPFFGDVSPISHLFQLLVAYNPMDYPTLCIENSQTLSSTIHSTKESDN